MQNIINFVRYNNAFPILLAVIFMGAGGALAASPAAQGGILTAEQQVRSVDNTYITSLDVSALPFAVTVTGISEDAVQYYVQYTIETVGIVEDVWQPIIEPRILTVHKSALRGNDLGLYVQEELAEVREYEINKINETKSIEIAKGQSQKVVATVYSGLIGAVLSESSETFPAYVPVVSEVTEVAQPIDVSELKPSPTFDANAPVAAPQPTPAPEPSPTSNEQTPVTDPVPTPAPTEGVAPTPEPAPAPAPEPAPKVAPTPTEPSTPTEVPPPTI